jgi:hypothetical protein
MAGEFPPDLRADIQAEVLRLLPVLKAAGWTVDPIRRETTSDTSGQQRVTFSAKSITGKQVLSSCPESRLLERLTALMAHTT